MKNHILLLLVVILSFFTGGNVFAQQTIITVPSSDVLPTGHFILKESNRIAPLGDIGTYQITPTMTFGTGWGTETSIGLGTGIVPDEATSLKLDIAAKKVFFLGSQTRLTVGGRVSPYLNTGRTPDSFLFTHGTYRIRKTKTALTAGVYLSGRGDAPNKFGAILGVDQVIIPNKLRLVGQYMSNDDSWGGLSIGLKYRPMPDLSITTAVILPTQTQRDNVTFLLSFSKYFGDIRNVHAKIKEEKKDVPTDKEKL